MSRIVEYIGRWVDRKREEKMMHAFGGIQRCPWCRQWAQSSGDWHFKTYEENPYLDVLTCGVCGGTSLWRFELGMLFEGSLEPPVPESLETGLKEMPSSEGDDPDGSFSSWIDVTPFGANYQSAVCTDGRHRWRPLADPTDDEPLKWRPGVPPKENL
ncbi:hypothetical protein [Roseibium sp. Sym1]|uniref:hypothetical protein n=1 Tax=Roseibium sp. Sym1 TaxID=3016006 RepID=UPI0022B42897|nr:hypothetical protein [Roseibium sp. Sym1]